METALGEQTAEQFRKIEYLNIIGNLGPLLGLLGTVMGMIEAFDQMHRSGGNAKPAELANGISDRPDAHVPGIVPGRPVSRGVRRPANSRRSAHDPRCADRRGNAPDGKARRSQARHTGWCPSPRCRAVPQPGIPGVRKPGLPTPAPAPVISG